MRKFIKYTGLILILKGVITFFLSEYDAGYMVFSQGGPENNLLEILLWSFSSVFIGSLLLWISARIAPTS